MTASRSSGDPEPEGTPAQPFPQDLLAALAAGLGGAHTMTVSIGWMDGLPAIFRDAPPALAMADDKPLNVHALMWRAARFESPIPGRLPPRLRDDWTVHVRGGRLVAVDTQFGASAATLGLDWITVEVDDSEILGDHTVPAAWLDDARQLGGVVLVAADLGVGQRTVDDGTLIAAIDEAIAAGRLLVGLARLDYTP